MTYPHIAGCRIFPHTPDMGGRYRAPFLIYKFGFFYHSNSVIRRIERSAISVNHHQRAVILACGVDKIIPV